MPLALSPTETFDAVLTIDEDTPDAERPTFVFRYQTSREYRDRMKLLDAWDEFFDSAPEKPDAKAERRRREVYENLVHRSYLSLRLRIAGWRNVPVLGDPLQDLDAILTDAEARELLATTARMSRLQVPEKKDSESPSPGATGAAAPGDAPTTAPGSPSREASGTSSSAPPAEGETPSAPSAEGAAGGN